MSFLSLKFSYFLIFWLSNMSSIITLKISVHLWKATDDCTGLGQPSKNLWSSKGRQFVLKLCWSLSNIYSQGSGSSSIPTSEPPSQPTAPTPQPPPTSAPTSRPTPPGQEMPPPPPPQPCVQTQGAGTSVDESDLFCCGTQFKNRSGLNSHKRSKKHMQQDYSESSSSASRSGLGLEISSSSSEQSVSTQSQAEASYKVSSLFYLL